MLVLSIPPYHEATEKPHFLTHTERERGRERAKSMTLTTTLFPQSYHTPTTNPQTLHTHSTLRELLKYEICAETSLFLYILCAGTSLYLYILCAEQVYKKVTC